MGISGVLGFVALAGWVALVAGIGLAVASASQARSPRGGVTIAVIGVVVGVLFSVISQGVIVVQPQEVAVVFDTIGGDLLEPRGPGIHIVIPVLQEATYYSIAQREYTMSGVEREGALSGNDAVVARTADGQEVRIDATIIYSIDPAQVNTVHERWESRFENGLIRPTVRGIIRDEVARYGVEEVYSSQREALRSGVKEFISNRFTPEGFIVTDFLIRDIQFSTDFAASVELKQIAEQESLRAAQEAERLRIQSLGKADAARNEADGAAYALTANARAEAEAILIRAQADAEALSLINEQLQKNPNLIQWRYVDELGDNIEMILLPSNSPFLFDFQALQGQVPAVDGASTMTVAPQAEAETATEATTE